MSTFASNSGGHRAREDGHAILILEASEGERTFSDYPNETTCLETLVNMYEEYRTACCERSEGDLKEFHSWMGDFFRIEMFVYDQSISRYKHSNREKLTNLFEEDGNSTTAKIKNSNDNDINSSKKNRKCNGYSRGSAGSVSMDDEDEVIGEQIMEEEENWDE